MASFDRKSSFQHGHELGLWVDMVCGKTAAGLGAALH